jgi:hypothetical protein
VKIGPSVLSKLAEMICGDAPFTYFPYRSSSYLTRFFQDIDLDYVHDGSTRRHWVRSVLDRINNDIPSGSNMPSNEMVIVIKYLLHHDHFADKENTDYEKAVVSVNKALKSNGLKVSVDSKTQNAKLVPIYGEFVSTATEYRIPEKVITFCPEVFRVTTKQPQDRLIAVMMPFRAEFDQTYNAIKNACIAVSLTCFRADDIWENTTFIQDIFELIYCSRIVVVDFSGRNPNVMYETGVAHTLGKHVIPITQSIDDVPSDLRHHRVLKYLPNNEGYGLLQAKLEARLRQLS